MWLLIYLSVGEGKYTMQKTLYLWLLECREGKLGRLFTFYANDEQEAETYTNEYLMLHPELSRVSLSERPDGFIFFNFHRPGTLIYKEQQTV